MTTIIKEFQSWEQLIHRPILSKYTIIKDMGDIHYFPGVKVESEEIIITHCDKNFVYYWLDRNVFPNAKKIYLNSHPCEAEVFYRKFNIQMSDNYKSYRARWAPDSPNVNIISQKEMDEIISKWSEETKIIYDIE